MTQLSQTILAFTVISAIGCSSTPAPSASSSTCPKNGVVPADLRDVERAGEGLVSTTFGSAASGHVADFGRAASVLATLKQVWDRTKTACPDLPSASVSSLNDAITKLDTAIPKQDQKSAVYAANQVGLAVVDLFDAFHPEAPKQIVRMDAVFRQVGIDAHYGDLVATGNDVQSISGDWSASKSAVGSRVPTCHRVAGTATVSGDIEASLAAMNAALGPKDTATLEQESDNGALEVDVLELLFDCPPDNVTPTTGLGSACAAGGAACGAGLACDPASSKCAPDPKAAKIGTPCSNTAQCGTDARSACNTEAGDGYPGGYCGMEPCDDIQVCPPGATCVAIGGETSACFQSCLVDSDCRTAEGYVCQLFVTTPPAGFGPSDHACAFPCKDDSQCQKPLTCDVASGKCRP